MSIPRSEHPKPQFRRDDWVNLNGEWDFCVDNERKGRDCGYEKDDAAFDKKIIVPFCPESLLSGIQHKDFMYGVWYKKQFCIDASHIEKRAVLHIGAADYETFVYVNGELAGTHKGGYVSFSVDITSFVKEGTNDIVVYCEDDTRSNKIPSGKQSDRNFSYSCVYTRTTGIWQTVWIEFTEKTYLKNVKLYPDYRSGKLVISATGEGCADFTAVACYKGKETGRTAVKNANGVFEAVVDLSEIHLWEPGHGRLYDLELNYGADTVHSYFGLRNIWFDGYKFMLNGRSVFQRLILDQGFYPDGIYTAPTDDDLIKDIKLSMAAGYNGARLHEKVFEERFLYHADKMGYLVWGEYPNWGLDHTIPESIYSILPEWLEEIERDFNHPSIIGWCPFNETWDQHNCRQYDPLIGLVYKATKSADHTRPCIDTSGNFHVETDIYDVHDYDQDPEVFKNTYDAILRGEPLNEHVNEHGMRQEYKGGPLFVSEFGGIKWSPVAGNERTVSWGYGNAPKTEEEFKLRYKGLVDALLDNEQIFGFCYTQLTDVEQEQNGLYTYSRDEKFPAEFLYSVTARKAAIED